MEIKCVTRIKVLYVNVCLSHNCRVKSIYQYILVDLDLGEFSLAVADIDKTFYKVNDYNKGWHFCLVTLSVHPVAQH